MADEKDEEKNKSEDRAPLPTNVRRKSVREVIVTHLDAPPRSGKREIHSRRPAPIVPTREERTGEHADDKNAEKPASE